MLQGVARDMQSTFTASCFCCVGVQSHTIIVACLILNCMFLDAMSLQRECSPCYNRIMCCGCLSVQSSVHSLHCVGSTFPCLFLYATFTMWHASIHSARNCHPLSCFVIACANTAFGNPRWNLFVGKFTNVCGNALKKVNFLSDIDLLQYLNLL